MFVHIWRMRARKKRVEEYEKFGRQVTLPSLKKIDGVIGRGLQSGSLRGAGHCRLDTHEFAASGKTAFDPNAPLLPKNDGA